MSKWGKYKKHYRKEWESEDALKAWIAPVLQDPSKARCKYYKSEIRAQLRDLKDHAETKRHKANCLPNVNTSIKSFARPTTSSDGEICNDQKRREIRVATYVACHTSINALDDLSDILEEEFGKFRMHRTKCTAMIKSVLAPHFRDELKSDIGESPFSLYLDETTDITVIKLLCICVKYRSIKHGKFISTYLGLVELSAANARAITDAILAFLETYGLNINNMVGIATDGASVMVGKHHSVFTLLKELLPDLKLIRCVCHSLDIVAKKAMDHLPSNVDFMIRETFNWFSHSAKRQSEYKLLFETLNDGLCPLKLLSPCTTRWLGVADSIDRVLQQKDALKLHFGVTAGAEHCYTARLLSEMYSDQANVLYMQFLRPILGDIKAVNKIFQLETGDSLGVFRDLERLYLSTLKRVAKPSVFRMNSDCQLKDLDLAASSVYLSAEDADLGTTFQEELRACSLAPEARQTISARCFAFIRELLVQYQSRLADSLDMLRKMELLSPKSVISTMDRPRVRELPMEFFRCSIDTLDSQWRNVSSAGFYGDQPIDVFWMQVEAFKDAGGNACFKDLALGAIRLLSLPISNAHVERAFSQVALLKDSTQNRMGLSLLSSLMEVRAGLSRNGWTSATFRPPKQFRLNYSMYE